MEKKNNRILSVDVLRGFDMFWLVGGTGLAVAIVKLFAPGLQEILLPQFEHAKWEGFHFYDLIFPLFDWSKHDLHANDMKEGTQKNYTYQKESM